MHIKKRKKNINMYIEWGKEEGKVNREEKREKLYENNIWNEGKKGERKKKKKQVFAKGRKGDGKRKREFKREALNED